MRPFADEVSLRITRDADDGVLELPYAWASALSVSSLGRTLDDFARPYLVSHALRLVADEGWVYDGDHKVLRRRVERLDG